MTTKIPVELSSTPGIVDGSNATAITIDSSERVGIGTTAPDYPLDVQRNSAGVIGQFISLDGSNNPRLVIYGDSTGTHIQHTWSSTASNLVFEVGGSEGSGSEKMRIDTNGNIGIGTTSPSMKVNISHADQDGLRFNTTNSAESFIDFGDTDDNDIGRISYDHADNHMAFRTNNAERMRIDSSGNVGISIDPENTYTSYTALEISRSGSIYANNAADDLNIGTNFYLESGGNWRAKNTETASLLQFDNGAVNIYTAASTTADNNISWNHKISFPNLGGIAFNGDTAQANALDDYEEGTWTPTSGVSLTTTTACRYVKVGTQVTITFDITFASSTSGSQPIIGNLPFSLTTYNGGYPNWQNTGSGVMIHCAGTQGNLYNSVTNAAFTYQAVAGKRVIGTIVGIVA